jgi:hypothetical protein
MENRRDQVRNSTFNVPCQCTDVKLFNVGFWWELVGWVEYVYIG